MARNRKRAKERRARQPEAVISARRQRGEAPPAPLAHATPDAELAEAQLAVGRPDLETTEPDVEPAEDAGPQNGADGEIPDALIEPAEPYELDDEAEDEDEEMAAEARALAHPGHTAAPARRENIAIRLITFLQGCWNELQRVQWPDRRQVWQATGVVIGFVIVAGLYLGAADEVASKIMTFVLK